MANIDNNTTNLENILSDIDNIADPVSGTLSITVNGMHDVSTYATANVNVQSAPVLLWTNASPTSAFNAQTVTLATGYDAFLVEMTRPDYQYTSVAFLPFTSTAFYLGTAGYWNNRARAYARLVNSARDGLINFGGAWESGDSNINYYYATPTRIWGVKFTL